MRSGETSFLKSNPTVQFSQLHQQHNEPTAQMLYPLSILGLYLLALIHLAQAYPDSSSQDDPIPFETRAHWMRRANLALLELSSPCPFAAFGAVIVDHSDTSLSPLGKEVCIGVNRNHETGNPTLHGEVSAINNCTAILTDLNGEYRLSPMQALKAFSQLSLYTNGEPCPMCATAIAWSAFASITYGTSIETLAQLGWSQIGISSSQILESAAEAGVAKTTRLVKGVLANETDPFYGWQFRAEGKCPTGCARLKGKDCAPAVEKIGRDEL